MFSAFFCVVRFLVGLHAVAFALPYQSGEDESQRVPTFRLAVFFGRVLSAAQVAVGTCQSNAVNTLHVAVGCRLAPFSKWIMERQLCPMQYMLWIHRPMSRY
jgi:hypothetical protein